MFVVSIIILNIYNDKTQKYGNIIVQDLRKYEKSKHEQEKLKLNIDFFNDAKLRGVFLKYLIFKLPNVSKHDC